MHHPGTKDDGGNYSANYRRALDRQRERKGYPNDIRDNGIKKQSMERKNNRGVRTLRQYVFKQVWEGLPR
jgi:hypothetical protein